MDGCMLPTLCIRMAVSGSDDGAIGPTWHHGPLPIEWFHTLLVRQGGGALGFLGTEP